MQHVSLVTIHTKIEKKHTNKQTNKQTNLHHASKFQLTETTTFFFLSISLDKITISISTKHATCILDKITISVLTKQATCI